MDGLKELFSGNEGSEDYAQGQSSNCDASTTAIRSRPNAGSSNLPKIPTSSTSAAATARNLPLPTRGLTKSQEEQKSMPMISQSPSLTRSTESKEEHLSPLNSPASINSTPVNRSKSTATYILKSPTLPHLKETVSQAIASLAQPNGVLLILDNPDLFLAATSTSAISLTQTIQNLRSHANVHSTIVTLAADGPLLFPADQHSTQPFTDPNAIIASPLSIQSHHAALVTGLAHHASSILSVRLLDTGFAGDVSGVLRVGVGGGVGADRRKNNKDIHQEDDESMYDNAADDYEDDEEEIESGLTNTGKEMLYFIGAGGDVKVFN